MIGVDPVNMTKTEPHIPCLALRARNAAKALGISERLLWTWTNEGAIPHMRIGKTLVYPVDSLREWLWKNAETSAAKEG